MSSEVLRSATDIVFTLDFLTKGRLAELLKHRAKIEEKKFTPYWIKGNAYEIEKQVVKNGDGTEEVNVKLKTNGRGIPPINPAMDAVIQTADFSKMREHLTIGKKNWRSWIELNKMIATMLTDSEPEDISVFLSLMSVYNAGLQSLAGSSEEIVKGIVSSPYAYPPASPQAIHAPPETSPTTIMPKK